MYIYIYIIYIYIYIYASFTVTFHATSNKISKKQFKSSLGNFIEKCV